MIWAFGSSDPTSETSLSSADYHGNNRGTAARRLLDPPGPPAKLPDDAVSIELHLDQVSQTSDYRKTSNISPTFVGNNIVDNSDVVGASPVGAAPTTSSF